MTSQPVISAANPISTWDANLQLEIARNPRGSRLVRNSHYGPLYVQKPFYPEGEDVAHIYLLHPPGGLVSGDLLEIDVTCGEAASALLTTPGAGRVYRARADESLQRQRITLDVKAQATLEWFPLETIVFNGARAQLETRVSLGQHARYTGWEVTSLGLPANGIEFTRGELTQLLRVEVEGELRLCERLHLRGNDRLLKAQAGLRGMPINGLFVAGPFPDRSVRDAVLAQLRSTGDDACFKNCWQGVTWIQDFVVGRYLGSCSEQARTLFENWWSYLRPVLIQRPACRPRIWLT